METDLEFDENWESPLSPVLHFLNSEKISFEQTQENQVRFKLDGSWSNYALWFRWMPEPNLLQIGLGINITITAEKAAQAAELLTQINEHLLLGHFDLWSEDLTITFRHSQLLDGATLPGEVMIEQMIAAAMEGAEFLYPALHVLSDTAATTSQAMEMALMETAGEA